jgi:predicted RNA polymerase sigma factor
MERLKERGNLRCLDQDQEISIRGEDETTDYQRLEIIMIPCQPDLSIGKKCPYSLQQTIDWLGPLDMMMAYNSVTFN